MPDTATYDPMTITVTVTVTGTGTSTSTGTSTGTETVNSAPNNAMLSTADNSIPPSPSHASTPPLSSTETRSRLVYVTGLSTSKTRLQRASNDIHSACGYPLGEDGYFTDHRKCDLCGAKGFVCRVPSLEHRIDDGKTLLVRRPCAPCSRYKRRCSSSGVYSVEPVARPTASDEHRRLIDGQAINDVTVDGYLDLIVRSLTRRGQPGVYAFKTWWQKAVQAPHHIDRPYADDAQLISAATAFFFPIFVGPREHGHWMVMIFESANSKWLAYNSYAAATGDGYEAYKTIAQQELALALGDAGRSTMHVTVSEQAMVITQPQQPPGSADCGVMSLHACRVYALARQQAPASPQDSFRFNYTSITDLRRTMLRELLDGRLYSLSSG